LFQLVEIGGKMQGMEGSIGVDLLETYTGSDVFQYQQYILLTNASSYVKTFAELFKKDIKRGSAMTSCHAPEHNISIIYFGVGSPVAAFIIELLSFVRPKATLMLGTCHGLREEYSIGDFFNPVAAIRGEGTSFDYLPERCPSLSSFVIQRYVCQALEQNALTYHTGVTHTTNILLWTNKEIFKNNLLQERSQSVDNECATLFTTGFVFNVPVGAMMLMVGVPKKENEVALDRIEQKQILAQHYDLHLNIGLKVLKNMQSVESEGFGYQF
jgi:AMP nucleosidase